MPAILYGGGSLYGGGALYGRSSAALVAAQEARVRETALQVIVKDAQLNKWEYFTGSHAYPDNGLGRDFYKPVNSAQMYEADYWSYRGGTHMFKLGNGNIIRLRNGDPSNVSDRQIWVQTITDPTVASQWASWSVLYSGTHYGVAGYPDSGNPAVYHTVHARASGIYRDNTLVWNNNIFEPDAVAIGFKPIENWPGGGWIVTVRPHTYDGKRSYSFWYTDNVASATPEIEQVNFNWIRADISGILVGSFSPDPYAVGNRMYNFINAPLYTDSRSTAHGAVLGVFEKNPNSLEIGPIYPIRGVGGGGGINYIAGTSVVQLSDGYYYLFGFETHTVADVDRSEATSLGYGFPVWLRSKDLYHWSEPVVGPPVTNAWGFGGVVESGAYLYWADNGLVYRRPTAVIEHDISNYVPSLEFDLPPDNQPGTGSAVIANPDGVNDFLKDFSDNEVIVKIGLKTADGTYEYSEFDKFFIKATTDEVKGEASRLNLTFGNLWDRLDNDFKDITNFVGQFTWDDWQPTGKNQPFNYYFASDTNPVVTTGKKLRTRGTVLLTNWKGHNPDITVSFYNVSGTATPKVIARYIDSKNMTYVELDGSTVKLVNLRNGVTDTINSWSVSVGSQIKIRVRLRWNYYSIWFNDSLLGTDWMNHFIGKPGYCGVGGSKYDIGWLHVEDFEYNLTMGNLVKAALAMGDFHDTIVADGGNKAFAIIWGPQTDLPKISDALFAALEAEKLQLIWQNGSVIAGKFNDDTVMKVIEDTVVESEQVDEAKRRINLASVDGNEDFWLEVDTDDATRRGRMLVAYFDLPELLDLDAVKERAREEIRRSAQGSSPGGTTPLYFDLFRMDTVEWVDNRGNSTIARIEGFSVSIDQSTKPHQRQTFDLSDKVTSISGGLMDETEPSE